MLEIRSILYSTLSMNIVLVIHEFRRHADAKSIARHLVMELLLLVMGSNFKGDSRLYAEKPQDLLWKRISLELPEKLIVRDIERLEVSRAGRKRQRKRTIRSNGSSRTARWKASITLVSKNYQDPCFQNTTMEHSYLVRLISKSL